MSDFQSQSLLLRLLGAALGNLHPIRLATGLSFGVLTKMFVDGISVAFPSNAFFKAISAYEMYWFLIVCTPLTFVRMVFGNRNAPETIVHILNSVQAILDRAELSRAHERMVWRTLLDKYVAAAKPDLGSLPDMGKILEETTEELHISSGPTPA